MTPMCLAIPGKVIKWIERESPFATATVEFGGVRRCVSMDCVPEANEGEYVIVHAGIAISRIDRSEAMRVLDALEELELAELRESVDDLPIDRPGTVRGTS